MGGGNGQKAKMAREKNLEKQKTAASKGITFFFCFNFHFLIIGFIIANFGFCFVGF